MARAMRPATSASMPASMPTSPVAPPPATPTSPWHSPVPYLFGGLAAMLGLIALALLILACSYWKLNSYLDAGDAPATSSGGPGATNGEGSKSPAVAAASSPAGFADLVAVVMAGEKMPTFLAAPIVHRAAGGDTSATVVEGSPETEEEKNRGEAGEGESGERDRQLDLV